MIIRTTAGDRLPLTSIWVIGFKDRPDGTVEAQFTPSGPDHQFWDAWCAGAMMVELIISREEANRIQNVAPHLFGLSRTLGPDERRPLDEARPARKPSRWPPEAKQTALRPERTLRNERAS